MVLKSEVAEEYIMPLTFISEVKKGGTRLDMIADGKQPFFMLQLCDLYIRQKRPPIHTALTFSQQYLSFEQHHLSVQQKARTSLPFQHVTAAQGKLIFAAPKMKGWGPTTTERGEAEKGGREDPTRQHKAPENRLTASIAFKGIRNVRRAGAAAERCHFSSCPLSSGCCPTQSPLQAAATMNLGFQGFG